MTAVTVPPMPFAASPAAGWAHPGTLVAIRSALTPRHLAVGGAGLALVLLLAGLWLSSIFAEARRDTPPIALDGGGFVFNYRIAEVTYGLVARFDRSVPVGTRIVASFENPAGGAPLVVEQVARAGLAKATLRSPPVTGVVKDKPYAVDVRLIDPATGAEIGRLDASFRSNVDQSVMPAAPLTVGPGYQKPTVP